MGRISVSILAEYGERRSILLFEIVMNYSFQFNVSDQGNATIKNRIYKLSMAYATVASLELGRDLFRLLTRSWRK